MLKSLIPLGGLACLLAAGCATPIESEATTSAPAKPAVASSSAAGSVEEGMTTTTFKVDGMTCGGCRGEVKNVLSKTPGVKECQVEETGVVTVTFDDSKLKKEDLVAAVNDKTDFKATL